MSPTFRTYNGLQQGALSSPILFNFYINDLIDLLNNVNVGINIGRMKMNNLLFADDIMIMTKTKKTYNNCYISAAPGQPNRN